MEEDKNCVNHPERVLFTEQRTLPELAPCEHYAGSRRYMERALALQTQLGPVFDVTCDCEDGARRGEEAEQVRLILEILLSPTNLFSRVGVRIHDVCSGFWEMELREFLHEAGGVLPYITLPKARGVDDVKRVLGVLQDEASHAGLKTVPRLHVLIETPGALREVWQIAGLGGIESLDFGLMDFVSAHFGAISSENMKSPGQFTHPLLVRAKTEVASAALAHGVVPSHNVTLDIRNPEVAFADAKQARESFGFLRMWSVHPIQIEPIIRAMTPSSSQVERAGRVLLLAQQAGWGPIEVEGELLDRASYRYHWSILKQGRAGGLKLEKTVELAFFA